MRKTDYLTLRQLGADGCFSRPTLRTQSLSRLPFCHPWLAGLNWLVSWSPRQVLPHVDNNVYKHSKRMLSAESFCEYELSTMVLSQDTGITSINNNTMQITFSYNFNCLHICGCSFLIIFSVLYKFLNFLIANNACTENARNKNM